MKKTILDNEGDPIEVETFIGKRVRLNITELDTADLHDPTEDLSASAILEVNAALKLARALIKAAVAQNDDDDE